MKNKVVIELTIDIDTCWLSLLTYIDQRIDPLLRNIPHTINIPDYFMVDNSHPRCKEYREMMSDIDSALSREEHDKLNTLINNQPAS